MSRRLIAVAASVLASTLALGSAPASADPDVDTPYSYSGYAGGTFVRILGGAVRSDLTSASGVTGTTYPASQSNTLATASIDGLATVGVISTDASATKEGDVLTQTSHAETATISLLDGLIKADAVDTTTSVERDGTALSGTSDTDFVRLTVGDTAIPLRVANNFSVNIPGIASVTLNERSTTIQDGKVQTTGSAIKVTLLRAAHESPIGTTIIVNPTSASLFPSVTNDATKVGGYAYGTYVAAKAGSGINVVSGPTARVDAPAGGTFGYTRTNSTLAVDLPKIVSAGAVESSSNSTSVPVTADVRHTNEVARVNLLNGVVTADAVKVTARVRKLADGTIVREPKTEFVNLRLLGVPLKLDLKANTSIVIPGLAKLVLNEQVTTASRTTVTGLHLTLTVPLPGLPVGSEVQVAVASSWVG